MKLKSIKNFPSFLKVAVNQLSGLCDLRVDESGKLDLYDGVDAHLLNFLAEIFDFEYELVSPADKQWGKPYPNGTWSGLIGKVVNGEADIALCGLGLSEHRKEVVDFTDPYDDQKQTFAVRLPEPLPKFLSFVLPFPVDLWTMMIALVVLMPLVWKALLTVRIPMKRLYLNSFSSVVNRPVKIKTRSGRDYIVLGAWLSAMGLMSASYSTVLLSYLTYPLKENVIRDHHRLMSAVLEGRYRCMVVRGTLILDNIMSSPHERVRKAGELIIKNGWFIEPSKESVEKAMEVPNTAVISSRQFFRNFFHDRVAVADDYIFSVYVGLAMGKRFCCKEVLIENVRTIVSSGLYHKWQEDYRVRAGLKTEHSCAGDFDEIRALELKDMLGAFSVLYIGYTFSLLALCGERVFGKKKKPRVQRFEQSL